MGLSRRASQTRTEPAPAPVAPALLARISDPDLGSIKRRWLRRKLAGIIAVGPSGPDKPQPEPEARMSDSAEAVAHQGVVAQELHEIDKYAKQLDARLMHMPEGSYEGQELAAERVQLRLLREEVMRDLVRWPVGDEAQRRYISIRAREIREQLWASAERLAAAGEHREARQRRIDALRSRHLSEREIGLRQSLSGY